MSLLRSLLTGVLLCLLTLPATAAGRIGVSPDRRYVIFLKTDKKTYASVDCYDRVTHKTTTLIGFSSNSPMPSHSSEFQAVWSRDSCVAISVVGSSKGVFNSVSAFRIAGTQTAIINIIDDQTRIDHEVVDHWDAEHAL